MVQKPVSSEQVEQHLFQVKSIAARFRDLPGMIDNDDLVQAGWIRVWRLLQAGIPPTRTVIRHAMIDEIRRAKRMTGAAEIPDDLADDFMAPLGGDQL